MDRFSRVVEVRTGVRMPYYEQGDTLGTPLVLVHAFAPTMRGHGDASRPESGYRSSDFASDIAAFMEAVHIEAAVIAGGSSGGLVGQRFAIDFPDHTLGLVLLGAPLTLGNKPFTQGL
jgi:non-heme chloroperoxidase